MANILAETTEWFHHRNHHDQEAAPVTTPPRRTMLSDLSAIASELNANPLVEELAERRLGAQLNADQRHTVVVLVASLEAENTQPQGSIAATGVQPAAGVMPQPLT